MNRSSDTCMNIGSKKLIDPSFGITINTNVTRIVILLGIKVRRRVINVPSFRMMRGFGRSRTRHRHLYLRPVLPFVLLTLLSLSSLFLYPFLSSKLLHFPHSLIYIPSLCHFSEKVVITMILHFLNVSQTTLPPPPVFPLRFPSPFRLTKNENPGLTFSFPPSSDMEVKVKVGTHEWKCRWQKAKTRLTSIKSVWMMWVWVATSLFLFFFSFLLSFFFQTVQRLSAPSSYEYSKERKPNHLKRRKHQIRRENELKDQRRSIGYLLFLLISIPSLFSFWWGWKERRKAMTWSLTKVHHMKTIKKNGKDGRSRGKKRKGDQGLPERREDEWKETQKVQNWIIQRRKKESHVS